MATQVTPQPPQQLSNHLVFAGSDLDAARDAVGRVFCSHSLRLVRARDKLAVRQYAAKVGELTLSHIAYGAAVDIEAGDIERFFCVQLPVEGRAEIACGPQRIVSSSTRASVITPTDYLRMRWAPDAVQLIVKIDRSLVERALGQWLGHAPTRPIRLRLGMDVNAVEGARWRAIYELMLAEIGLGGGGMSHRASTAAVQDLVISSLLLAHPNNYSEELHSSSASAAGPPYVRRAMDYARENLGAPLTVGELADVAGVSVRALQAGFLRSTGHSPTAWIRDRRLDGARAALEAAEPGDGTRITDVALRWGFSHFGRFSQVYAQRFGERPSQTLRR